MDWMELIFELYGSVEDWPDNLKLRIAHALGYCSAHPVAGEEQKALKRLKQWEQEELEKEEEKTVNTKEMRKKRQSCIREEDPARTFSVILLPERGILTGKR